MSFTSPPIERLVWSRELDPELRGEGLLALAGRHERRGQIESAGEIYAELARSPELPALVLERARQRLAALQGGGNFGARAEVLLGRFMQEAVDPASLVAMSAGSLAFRLGRLAVLGQLGGSASGILTRGVGARALAGLAGFGAEATAFPLAARFANRALGRAANGNLENFGRDWASSSLMLGALRAGGILPRFLAGGGRAMQALAVQVGMLGGILLGHGLELQAGLREPTSANHRLADALATLLHFNVAGRLNRSLMGEGFGRWEKSLDARSEQLERGPGGFPRSPTPFFIEAMATVGASGNPRRDPTLDRQEVFTLGSGSGGGLPHEILSRAHALRQEISPSEAWERRDSKAQEYLGLLERLPGGQRSSLDEMMAGIEMLSAWARSDQPFLKAIGHRYYPAAWKLFGVKFSHVDSDFRLEQKMMQGAYDHYELISQGNNARFMRQVVPASGVIVGTLHHHSLALQEGTPRYLALRQPIARILGSLRLGSEVLSDPALRRAYMESWFDSLLVLHATGDFIAQEVVTGLRQVRIYLQDPDPVRQRMAAEYYPQFWKLLHTVLRTNAFHGFDFGIGEEIAFLQNHRDLKSTARSVLEPVLEAHSHFVEFQIMRHIHRPTQLDATIRGFLADAGEFRRSIEASNSASLREHYVQAYLETMLACFRTSVDLLPWPRSSSSQDVLPDVVREMSQGLATLRERWTSENGSFQLRALDQYWRLAREYPIPAGLADQLHIGPNLHPLSMLAAHNPDPRVRQSARILLQNLLRRFQDGAVR